MFKCINDGTEQLRENIDIMFAMNLCLFHLYENKISKPVKGSRKEENELYIQVKFACC